MNSTIALYSNSTSPILFIQSNPRQVVSANKSACELFGKDLSGIEGFRGGQVFDCVHSMTEKGCGLDPNCENCKIKNAVVDSFESGQPHENVCTILDIKKDGAITPYDMEVSTLKIDKYVLVTVNKYQKKDS